MERIEHQAGPKTRQGKLRTGLRLLPDLDRENEASLDVLQVRDTGDVSPDLVDVVLGELTLLCPLHDDVHDRCVVGDPFRFDHAFGHERPVGTTDSFSDRHTNLL